MEPDSDGSSPTRPALPVSGEIVGALSLHRRSVRDAMEPPAIILLRKSVLKAQIPDADRD
ncbi:MAG: hypothetical protein ACF8MJ_05985 [Phycisphaerales bacterium JB050]